MNSTGVTGHTGLRLDVSVHSLGILYREKILIFIPSFDDTQTQKTREFWTVPQNSKGDEIPKKVC